MDSSRGHDEYRRWPVDEPLPGVQPYGPPDTAGPSALDQTLALGASYWWTGAGFGILIAAMLAAIGVGAWEVAVSGVVVSGFGVFRWSLARGRRRGRGRH